MKICTPKTTLLEVHIFTDRMQRKENCMSVKIVESSSDFDERKIKFIEISIGFERTDKNVYKVQ